jgi:hypothetical protein
MHVVDRLRGAPQTTGADNGILEKDPAIHVAAE